MEGAQKTPDAALFSSSPPHKTIGHQPLRSGWLDVKSKQAVQGLGKFLTFDELS